MKGRTLELVELSVADLLLDPRNARRHDASSVRAAVASLKEFGQLDVVVVRKGVVLAGNGLVLAARELKIDTVLAVNVDDLTDEEARAYAIADNKVAALSHWDFSRVAQQLAGLDQVMRDATGFDDTALQALDWKAAEPSDETFGQAKGRAELRKFYAMTTEQAAVVTQACQHARDEDQTLEDDGAALAAICQQFADAAPIREKQKGA